jgi:hypothetical protein
VDASPVGQNENSLERVSLYRYSFQINHRRGYGQSEVLDREDVCCRRIISVMLSALRAEKHLARAFYACGR